MTGVLPASGRRPAESSGGSFHSGREPLGVHNSWTDKPVGQSGRPPHVQQHHLPSSLDLPYRENIPVSDFPPPHGREFNPPAPKATVEQEKKKKKKLGDVVPPLCASRLKPIRQKTKNAVVRCCFSFLFFCFTLPSFLRVPFIFSCLSLQVSILDTGQVCMELLKCHAGQERVKEVLQISCDGSMVSPLWHRF